VDDFAPVSGDDEMVDGRVSGLLSERAGVNLATLSEREREVLELALTGLSARAIAERLTLTEATIRSHLSRIYAKLGVGGRVELLAHFHTQPPDEGRPSPSPSVETAGPRRRRVWPVVALAILLVMLSAGALFLWLRPDLPPATNLATVSQLVAQGQATSLDLRGDTLFVATADGRHYRVDGVDEAAFREILPEAIGTTAEVSISSSGDTLVPSLAFVAALLPVVLLLVAVLVAFRWFRRPPQPRPAG
jgi:DNA-binding CsgD family transcriptional regulator